MLNTRNENWRLVFLAYISLLIFFSQKGAILFRPEGEGAISKKFSNILFRVECTGQFLNSKIYIHLPKLVNCFMRGPNHNYVLNYITWLLTGYWGLHVRSTNILSIFSLNTDSHSVIAGVLHPSMGEQEPARACSTGRTALDGEPPPPMPLDAVAAAMSCCWQPLRPWRLPVGAPEPCSRHWKVPAWDPAAAKS